MSVISDRHFWNMGMGIKCVIQKDLESIIIKNLSTVFSLIGLEALENAL